MPGLARVLSKLGYCSRSRAMELARAGRVRVDGVVRRDPEFPVALNGPLITVDGMPLTAAAPVYLMLNKPRGLVTTAVDEKGRPTVFSCLQDAPKAHLSAVGRLDQASEGLLLFTNDTAWADAITSPAAQVEKTYHVQIDQHVDPGLLRELVAGIHDGVVVMQAKSALLLRQGNKNAWLEIVLEEGRNRQIRRMLEVRGIQVLRLVRVAIGQLELGGLAKGNWRPLSAEEAGFLAPGGAGRLRPGSA